MGLRDDLKSKISESSLKREQDLALANARLADERERKKAEAIAALVHLLSEETVKKIISDHIDKIGGTQVAKLSIKNGAVAMLRPSDHRGSSYDLSFTADPMTAHNCFSEPAVSEKLEFLRKEEISIDHNYDVHANALTVTFDYRRL